MSTDMQTRECQPTVAAGEAALLAAIRLSGPRELAAALRRIHDLALYHTTDHPIEQHDKEALLEIKMLWEAVENLGDRPVSTD